MTLGLLILRVVMGLTLAAHGSQKLFGWFEGPGRAGTAGMFTKLGFRWPTTMALLAGAAEFFGGLLFALGLLTPFAAIALVVVMLNAIITVHWQKGFFDHVIRSEESYNEKWLYVRDNPVRAGLVRSAEDWPYAGEVSALPY